MNTMPMMKPVKMSGMFSRISKSALQKSAKPKKPSTIPFLAKFKKKKAT